MKAPTAFIPALIASSLLGACSQTSPTHASSETAEAKSEAPQHVTAKPGADIQITSDYDGKTSAFETESFTIRIADGYASGTLDVRLKASVGLTLISGGDQSFSMSGDAPHEVPVTVSANADGRYYLTAMVTAETAEGDVLPASRGFAINVGEAAQSKNYRPNTPNPGSTSNGIIEMESEETISSE